MLNTDVGLGLLGGGDGLCRAGEAEGGAAARVCADSLDSRCGSLSGEAGLREEPSGALCTVKFGAMLGSRRMLRDFSLRNARCSSMFPKFHLTLCK